VELIAGGLVTLTVTFLVQVFVIPHVQARIRNRERWESDVIDLHTLVEEEIPRSNAALHSAGYELRYLSEWKQRDDINKDRLNEALESATSTFRETRTLGNELMARLSRLEKRVQRIRRRDQFWRRLTLMRIALHVALWDVENDGLPGEKRMSHEEWIDAWEKVRDRLNTLQKLIEIITNPIRPPRRRLLRRAHRRLSNRLRKLGLRVNYLESATNAVQQTP
jgi:transcriptional regulator of heat shock response